MESGFLFFLSYHLIVSYLPTHLTYLHIYISTTCFDTNLHRYLLTPAEKQLRGVRGFLPFLEERTEERET